MMEEDFWEKFYTTSEDNNRHGAYEILKILFDKTEGLFVEINGEDDPNHPAWKKLDKLLSSFDPTRAPSIVSTALLRGTFRGRSNLPSWKPCLEKVREHFKNIGLDHVGKLRGLDREI
jgi:hypothetical protein